MPMPVSITLRKNSKWKEIALEYTKTTDDATTIPAESNPTTYTDYATTATDDDVEEVFS